MEKCNNTVAYFICGGPGVGKSTFLRSLLNQYGGFPKDWEDKLQTGMNTNGVTSDVTCYQTNFGGVRLLLMDCPGITGPKGAPKVIAGMLEGLCRFHKCTQHGMIMLNEITNSRINSVNQLMALLAPDILSGQDSFWQQSIFVATKCGEVVNKKKQLSFQAAFRDLIRNDAFTGNSGKIDDKNILFSYLELEFDDDGEAISIKMRNEDYTIVDRLIAISKSSYKSVGASQVSDDRIINCVAKVNNVDPKDSEAYKEIQKKYYEQEAERIKMQKAFDTKIYEMEKQNQKALAKQEKLVKELKEKNKAKLNSQKEELEEKNRKAIAKQEKMISDIKSKNKAELENIKSQSKADLDEQNKELKKMKKKKKIDKNIIRIPKMKNKDINKIIDYKGYCCNRCRKTFTGKDGTDTVDYVRYFHPKLRSNNGWCDVCCDCGSLMGGEDFCDYFELERTDVSELLLSGGWNYLVCNTCEKRRTGGYVYRNEIGDFDVCSYCASLCFD